tara:strand:+ start:54 stop:665 length:612 start_codon:yes stop_codon:yes gene_type:complete
MCFQDIEQHKLILEKGKELLKVAFDSDKDLISNIINNSKNVVDNYNTEKLTVTDVSNKENGLWKSTLKKVIYANFFKKKFILIREKYNFEYDDEDILCGNCLYSLQEIFEDVKYCSFCEPKIEQNKKIKEKYYNEIEILKDLYLKSIEKTNFSSDLKYKYILLTRKIGRYYQFATEIQKTIKESLRLQIIRNYQEQNQELINK